MVIDIEEQRKNKMMPAQIERENALSILESNIAVVSKLYRECYLKHGRGSLLVYCHSTMAGHLPTTNDYRTKEEILDIFDNPKSKKSLANLINVYQPNSEGILVLITSTNATWFATVKLKSPSSR